MQGRMRARHERTKPGMQQPANVSFPKPVLHASNFEASDIGNGPPNAYANHV